MQDEATGGAIAAAGERLLSNRAARDEQRGLLARLRSELGEPGASERAAAEVVALMEATE